jgi:hypothetical protein
MNDTDQRNSTATLPYATGNIDHPNDSSAVARVGGVLSCLDQRWDENSSKEC